MLANVIQKNNTFGVIEKQSENNNVYQFPKMANNGTVKKTHSNKATGVSSEVYAFRTQEEISAIANVLNSKILNAKTEQKQKDAYRNKLLFLVGMNLGIRASDIRLLKWSFFFDDENKEDKKSELKIKKGYSLKPVKTAKKGKYVQLYFNQAIKNALNEYLSIYPMQDIDDYIFVNPFGEPITVQQMWNIIKNTAKEAGINQNIGTHSLRKTWGYWCWHNAEDKAKALVTLQQCFNHESLLTTQKYIGLVDTEKEEMFNSVNFGF